MAALTSKDKERIRYHTGYMEVSFAGSVQFGIPRPVQTVFLLEQAMNLLVDADAIARVVSILDHLDNLECLLKRAPAQLAAEKLGDLTLRGSKQGETYPDLLEREYVRWAKRLADIFGVPLYPYSARFRQSFGVTNVPVTSG
jgi:hypothetical protein